MKPARSLSRKAQNMTPKQQYEARKAERQRRREAKETLDMNASDIQAEETLDRAVTTIERIADALEALAAK